MSSSEQRYVKNNSVASNIVHEISLAQEQVKATESVVTGSKVADSKITPSEEGYTSSTTSGPPSPQGEGLSAPEWAVSLVNQLNTIDSAAQVVNMAVNGKSVEEEKNAETNRMIKLLSIASGKTTAQQEAEAGDIPYSQYIKEKEAAAKKENTAESGEVYSIDNSNDVIVLPKNNELSKLLGNLQGADKYKKIQQYILDVLSGDSIKLSDGKTAVVDKSDALHIANKSASKKTAEISQIKEIIEKAELYAEDTDVQHNKFDYFCYYHAKVEYDGNIFSSFINVGRAKNDGKYHIYDITKKIRDTANRINGLERPKPNEGYALQNDVSNDIIDQKESTVNSKSMQEGENNTSIAKEISEADRKRQGERQEKVKSLCDLFGLPLEWSDTVSRGKYNPNTRTITLNPNLTLTEMYIEVLKHEFTHDLENRKLYKNFKNYLFNNSEHFIKFCEEQVKKLKDKGIIDETATGRNAVYILRGYTYLLYKDSKELTAKEKAAFDREAAEREMICDFVAKKLLDKGNEAECIEALKELEENQRSAFDRFVDLIRNAIYHIKDAFGKTTLKDELEYLERRLKQVYESKVDKKKTAQGGENKFSLQMYTEHEIDNWKNSKRIILYENDAQFVEFIKDALSAKRINEKMYFGKIPAELAGFIKSETGIDVENYNCSLSANEIRKIFKDHGSENTEKPRGQRALTIDDVVNIPKVIQNPTEVNRGTKDYDGKPVLLFNNKERITVVAVVSGKHLDLRVQTAYAGIKKGNLATPVVEKSTTPTPEASHGTVSNNRVPQNDTTVNSNSMQENEKHSIDLEKKVSKKENKLVPEVATKTTPKAKKENINIPAEATELTNKYFRGELTQEEYQTKIDDLRAKAVGKYGAFKTGELAEDQTQIPKKVSDDGKVHQHVRTQLESGIMSDEIRTDVTARMLQGGLSYKGISNKKAQAHANWAVQNGTAVKVWDAAVNGDGKVGKEHIAIGETLLKLAAERNDAYVDYDEKVNEKYLIRKVKFDIS